MVTKRILVSIFSTKYVIGLKGESGTEISVHISIDTIELKGEPFEIFVKVGEKEKNK